MLTFRFVQYFCMKFWEVFFILNLCALSTALGNLNDSKPALIDRLGAPVLEKTHQTFGSQQCVFQKGEWEVHAYLIDGFCHMISYVKKVDGVAASAATAVFKTGYWKMLEGQPLGIGSGDSLHGFH